VNDGQVFFGSHDGNFYALNARNGELNWVFKTKGEKQFPPKSVWQKLELSDSTDPYRWDTWLSSPAVKNNTVFFGSGDGNFYALDKTTGEEKWKYETNAIIHSSPALAFGNVYFGGWDTFLHALDEKTGEEKWKFKTGEDTVRYNQTGITSSPVIVDSVLYFGCRDSHIYAVKALSGELIWKRYNDDIWVSSTPLVYQDKVLYPAGRPSKFIALNKLTGDSIYMHKTKTGTSSSFSLAGETVYYGDLNGILNAHDINTGKLIWTYQIPTSAEDTLHMINKDFSTSQEGFAAVVEKYKGIRGRNELRFALGAIHSSPVIKEGVVYFGAYDGYFYAIE
jgi:outer membrane protein assembly factor BamB